MELKSYVIEDRGQPDRLLVLLHGHDSTECEVIALGPLLDPAQRYLVVGLRGPLSAGPETASWYEIGPTGPSAESLEAARQSVSRTVRSICEQRGMDVGDTVIVGFSQGAALAIALALGTPALVALAGVVCVSGFLPEAEGVDYGWSRADGPDVLVIHGRDDEVVPVDFGRDLAATLRQQGSSVSYEELDAGHQWTSEAVTTIRDWLASVPGPDSV